MSEEGNAIGAGADAVEAATADAGVAGGANDANAAAMQQINAMRGELAAMQQMQAQSMQQMNAAIGAIQSGWQATPAPPQPVHEPVLPQSIAKLDEDDPYYEQFKQLAQGSSQRESELQKTVGELREQINNMNLSMSRQSVQQQVTQVMKKHQVPEELAEQIRTTAYAYLASAPQGQANLDGVVNSFMQSLGKYQEVARKKWADEARKPKPLSVVASQAGVSNEPPSSWEDAKARSLEMVEAMIGQG